MLPQKKLFYLVTLPIIYESNALILEDRKMIINIEKKFKRTELNTNEQNEVIRLSKKYKLDYSKINLTLFKNLNKELILFQFHSLWVKQLLKVAGGNLVLH